MSEQLFSIESVRFAAKVGKLLQDMSADLAEGGVIRVARVEFDFDWDGLAGSDRMEGMFLRREGLDEDGPLVVAVAE